MKEEEKEEALLVMRVLIDHGCEPDTGIADAMAQTWFTGAGINDQEYERGLGFASDHRWIVLNGPGRFEITKAGFSAATST